MKIFRIYLYKGDDVDVLAIASDKEQERAIRKAVREFARLDNIYVARNIKHPHYDRAVRTVESGFTAFLNGKGISTPEEETLSL